MQDQLIEQLTTEAAQATQDTPEAPQEPQDAPETPVEAPQEPQDAPEGQEAGEDSDALQRALKAERKRARDLEKTLKEYQAKDDEAAKAAMSEQEKAIAEAVAAAREAAKAEYDQQILKLRVEAKAGGMNFHDPALALSLLDVSADATDDEIVDALKGLADDRPYLVKTATPKMEMGPRATGDKGQISATSNEEWFRDLMTKK